MTGRHLRRRVAWQRAVWALASLAMLVGWFLMLRPTVLGGPLTYSIVSGHSMEPTYRPGDYVIARASQDYEKGDIVMFEVGGGVVVHRIVGGSAESGFVTQGDNNLGVDPWRPSPETILGEAWVHVPFLGRAVGLVRHPIGIGIMAWALTTMAVLGLTAPRGRHRVLSRRSKTPARHVRTAAGKGSRRRVGRPVLPLDTGRRAPIGARPWPES